MPWIYCESQGQAHMLARRWGLDDPVVKHLLTYTPPYVAKLSHKE